VRKVGGSIAALRNFGASLALGEVLVFLDADCLPPATWLERALAVRPAAALWGAHYLVPRDATWVGSVWAEFQAVSAEGEVSFLPSGDLFVGRDDFVRIGGFGESLETSEDFELCQRAKRHGMRVMAFAELGVLHEGTPRTLKQFYRQNRWHGKHVLRMFLANLPSRTGLPVVALSVWVLVMFWMALLVPVFALPGGHWMVAVTPLLLLILPAALLALAKTIRAGRIVAAPALWTLYMTYFLARAAALTLKPARTHR
jgi:cellulose synthase/poly-beta-1,6-N-acetylglucosamine synthase-like glycosyltransferase